MTLDSDDDRAPSFRLGPEEGAEDEEEEDEEEEDLVATQQAPHAFQNGWSATRSDEPAVAETASAQRVDSLAQRVDSLTHTVEVGRPSLQLCRCPGVAGRPQVLDCVLLLQANFQCPLYEEIHLMPAAAALAGTAAFRRLARLKQLGVSCHIFPSATHTRYDTCAGIPEQLARRTVNLLC